MPSRVEKGKVSGPAWCRSSRSPPLLRAWSGRRPSGSGALAQGRSGVAGCRRAVIRRAGFPPSAVEQRSGLGAPGGLASYPGGGQSARGVPRVPQTPPGALFQTTPKGLTAGCVWNPSGVIRIKPRVESAEPGGIPGCGSPRPERLPHPLGETGEKKDCLVAREPTRSTSLPARAETKRRSRNSGRQSEPCCGSYLRPLAGSVPVWPAGARRTPRP
jgi:hypothetical protein